MSTVVDDLVAKLGLEFNEAEWVKADGVLEGIRKRVEGMRAQMVGLRIGALMAKPDPKKAAALIGFPDGIPETVKKAEKGSNRIVGAIKGIAAAWLSVKALGVLKGMIVETAEFGGKINDLSQSTGIGTEALQEYAHAAQLGGSSLDTLVGAVGKLNTGIDKAATTGKGPAADALRELGLSASSLNKTIKKDGLEAGFNIVAEKLAAMPDGAKKNRLAFELLGKSGRELIPTINGLSDSIQDARDLGLVVADEDIKNLDDFGDNVDRLKGAFNGIKHQAVAALVPVMNDLVDGALEWLKANRELVRSGIDGFVKFLGGALKVLGKVVAGLAAAFAFVGEHWDVIEALALAVKDTIEWLARLAARLVLAIMAIGRAFAAAGRAIVDAIGKAWDFLVQTGNDIAEFFTETVPNAIVDAFDSMWENLKQGARDFGNFLRNLPGVKQALDLGEAIGDAIGGPSATEQALAAVRGQAEAAARPGSGALTTIMGGDVKIEVNSATGDPIAIGNEIDKRFREHTETLFAQAAEAL